MGLRDDRAVRGVGERSVHHQRRQFPVRNATLSFYDPQTRQVENEIFKRANGFKLGDVAQSMTLRGDIGWVVVNNSHVIFAIDTRTFREVGRITGFTSPRYIHFLSDEKAYVTQIWDNRIAIVNPPPFRDHGIHRMPGHDDAERLHGADGAAGQVCLCKLLGLPEPHPAHRHRTRRGGRRAAGRHPAHVARAGLPRQALDDHRRRVRRQSLRIRGAGALPHRHRKFLGRGTLPLPAGRRPSEIQINGTGDRLYWINNDIWRMPVDAEQLPAEPFIPAATRNITD